MDTAWIQVFVLTLTECIAPAGKSVCQEQQVQYQFVDKAECEAALQHLVDYSAGADKVLVNVDRSSCLPTTKEQPVFVSLDEANKELANAEGWGVLEPEQKKAADNTKTEAAHQERLASLPDCEANNRTPPCKVGQIIVEAERGEEMEVWRREN
ncbi:MAG TPA: hypothetical protein VNQ14_03185 [Woeseiaceae bacterium]|nr:hypothetical protein [Woeseiaceae bacterium]